MCCQKTRLPRTGSTSTVSGDRTCVGARMFPRVLPCPSKKKPSAVTRILITGVGGFIGSNLADKLAGDNRNSIIGIDNLAYGVKEQIPEAVEFHRVDIRSKEIYPLFQNVDYVFHFAAKNSISDCQLNPVETADINVTGTV